MIKKRHVVSLLSITAIIAAVSSISASPATETQVISPLALYSSHVVQLYENKIQDPVGKIVKYHPSNVKPLIVEQTKSHRRELTPKENEARRAKIDSYFSRIATGQESKYTKEFFDFLEENELVYYELGKQASPLDGGIMPLSTTSDISVNTPFGSYDSVNGWYEIWGGFNFVNDTAWWNEARNYWGFANPTGNIGGSDTVGINLDGGTNGAALKSATMQPIYRDAPGNFNGGIKGQYSAPAVTTRVGGLSSNTGGMFMFQDKSVGFGLGSDGYAKYANNFGSGAVKLSYDSRFAAATGNAATYYVHTWDKATITGITANSNGTFAITVANSQYATPTMVSLDYSY
ncbi:hypothetical protein [Paenibacillus sp. L3-i20]|uniref:hypothetical protein n=1 Tax=Paenibacillus sp. L3-i20 TaxID=2905833 RepID=UPI001EE07850|nr:hypothetical protein [Paenibacillus sp. L3-i20]GKU77507.1 hypothetical protein L3i20_v219040 [Paenibacillus sp. L3-i20]